MKSESGLLFAGADVLEDKNGKLYALELESCPGFVNQKDPAYFAKYITKLLKS